jgi:nucleoside-diphosphate-sugar epimerase
VRIFVTGGTGFVGAHVVTALQQRGHAVTCLVRDAQKAARVFGEPAPALVPGDLGDAPALARACATADAVVHLAGLTAARSRAELFAVNAGGTTALVEAIRAAGGDVRRFVHVSSLAAAGPVMDGVEPSGDQAARPVSDYGRSKLAGEEPVRRLALAWTILRPPAVYGPHDREFLRLFRLASRGVPIAGRVVAPVFGDGSQRLSMVFAGDLAQAIVRCLESDLAPGVYYPAHRAVTTSRALVTSIAAAVGVGVRIVGIPRGVVRPLLWLTGTAARLAGRATLLSADKANEILADAWTCSPASLERAIGWQAATDLADGLRRTAAWYREAGWL